MKTPWPRIKGSFPEVFKMYYDEIERGIRHQSGYLLVGDEKDIRHENDRSGWLTTGVQVKKQSTESVDKVGY